MTRVLFLGFAIPAIWIISFSRLTLIARLLLISILVSLSQALF